jgi:cell wall-associated NlpC family hydrolase
VAPIRSRALGIAVVPLVLALLAVVLVPQSGQASPKPPIDQVKAQLDALNAQAEVAQENLNQTRVQVAAGQRTLAQLEARVARSQVVATEARSRVGRLAAAAYRSGGVDQTVQLLLADDPTRFLEQVSALDTVTRHQSDLLRAAAVAEQRLAQDKLAAAQQLAALHALHAAAARSYAQVQTARDKATALLASLEAAQRAALAKAEAQARARAQAQAAAALAQARAAAARSRAAAAAAAKARSTSKPRTAHRVSHPVVHRSGGSAGSSGGSAGGSIGRRVVAYALAQVGDSYVWGATGPSAFDCSGLTMRAYAQVGVSLPHSSSAQYHSGRHVSAGQLQPGDLVFYYSPIHHVAIYIGGGSIVHAANPGEGVTIASLYSMPFAGAVRPY